MDAGTPFKAPAERGGRAAGAPHRARVPLKKVGVAYATDPARLLRPVTTVQLVATVAFRATKTSVAAVRKANGPAEAVTATVAPVASGVVPAVGVPRDTNAGALPITLQPNEAKATVRRRRRAGAPRPTAIVVRIG